MADELIQCGNDIQKIRQCAVKLYSKNTFLYNVLNTTLRNNDLGKVQSLGPFCYLLNSYLSQNITLNEDQIIYRGMNLTDEMIDEYRKAVNTEIAWPAFTSTTKNPMVAEMFSSNTLCIITLCRGRFVHGRDIADISHIPDEEEFLLSVGFMLYVEKVEVDSITKRHMIHLKSTCD
jgi:hypothetical protein